MALPIARFFPFDRYIWILLLIWTAVVTGFLAEKIHITRNATREAALAEANIHLNRDQILRYWAASHGGIYVPQTEQTPPNPNLAHVPERDIATPSGKKLTLMNPAYMIRQLNENFSQMLKVKAHITSLKPLRPENGPDEWERRALKLFQEGSREHASFTPIGEAQYLRLMRPMIASEDCLKCHNQQGYKKNDIIGGVSISLPMEQYLTHQKRHISTTVYAFSILWFIGLMALALACRSVKKRLAELEEAEKKLAASEEKFRTVANFTYDLEYWIAPDGSFVYVSPSAEKITGYSQQRFQNDPGLLLAITHPDDRQLLQDHQQQEMNQEDSGQIDFRIITMDGRERWISHVCQPVYNQQGETLGRRASNRDITNEKTAELEKTKIADNLRRSNRDLEDFAHIVSHDLQEPLSLVMAFSNRLEKKCGVELNDQCREYLHRITLTANRMQDLINGLLTYSRVTTKAQPFEHVNLYEITMDVLKDLEMRIDQSGGQIEVQELHVVEADPLQMRQLLQNIIGNALKYHIPGKTPKIKVTSLLLTKTGTVPTHCRLTVEDNGIGFDDRYQERIFEIFQRLHHHSQYQGVGLGLAICKKIVTRHAGSIAAESQTGEGAKFIIELPLKQNFTDF